MSINLKNKQEIIKEFGANEKDTGSAAVQIAMMSKKISELTEHLKSNKIFQKSVTFSYILATTYMYEQYIKLLTNLSGGNIYLM